MQARKLSDKRLDSTFACVDEAETTAGLAAEQLGFDEADQHRIRLAVREAMVNAVTHGNRFDSSKKIGFEIWEDSSGALAIEIGDEGAGFEEKRVPNPVEASNLFRPSGRGLLIMRAFLDEVAISRRNPSGTHVHMVKRPRTAQIPDRR